jgi:hypothetical protein
MDERPEQWGLVAQSNSIKCLILGSAAVRMHEILVLHCCEHPRQAFSSQRALKSNWPMQAPCSRSHIAPGLQGFWIPRECEAVRL